MNITEEGDQMSKILDKKKNNKQVRGNIAPKGEELRDTTANDRRFDFWDQPIEESSALSRVQGKLT